MLDLESDKARRFRFLWQNRFVALLSFHDGFSNWMQALVAAAAERMIH
jgi:hypothetical protein